MLTTMRGLLPLLLLACSVARAQIAPPTAVEYRVTPASCCGRDSLIDAATILSGTIPAASAESDPAWAGVMMCDAGGVERLSERASTTEFDIPTASLGAGAYLIWVRLEHPEGDSPAFGGGCSWLRAATFEVVRPMPAIAGLAIEWDGEEVARLDRSPEVCRVLSDGPLELLEFELEVEPTGAVGHHELTVGVVETGEFADGATERVGDRHRSPVWLGAPFIAAVTMQTDRTLGEDCEQVGDEDGDGSSDARDRECMPPAVNPVVELELVGRSGDESIFVADVDPAAFPRPQPTSCREGYVVVSTAFVTPLDEPELEFLSSVRVPLDLPAPAWPEGPGAAWTYDRAERTATVRWDFDADATCLPLREFVVLIDGEEVARPGPEAREYSFFVGSCPEVVVEVGAVVRISELAPPLEPLRYATVLSAPLPVEIARCPFCLPRLEGTVVEAAGEICVRLAWPSSPCFLVGLEIWRDGERIAELSSADTTFEDCFVEHRPHEYVLRGETERGERVVSPRYTVPVFVRGDANSSGGIDLTDAIAILRFLFLGDAAPACEDAADSDDDGELGINDAIRTLNWLFTGGSPPAPPAAAEASYRPEDCGIDLTVDALGCDRASATCAD